MLEKNFLFVGYVLRMSGQRFCQSMELTEKPALPSIQHGVFNPSGPTYLKGGEHCLLDK